MARYIDADVLREKAVPIKAFRNNGEDFLVIGLGYLLDTQSADVEPVARGEWVNDAILEYPACSVCSYMPMFDPRLDDIYYSRFCPNCGAHMDEAVLAEKGAK